MNLSHAACTQPAFAFWGQAGCVQPLHKRRIKKVVDSDVGACQGRVTHQARRHIMKTTQHTPGPWDIDEGFLIKASSFGQIANVRGAGIGFETEANANARLIAAAPELLEALERIAELLPQGEHPWEINSQERSAREIARNAIAKAHGENAGLAA